MATVMAKVCRFGSSSQFVLGAQRIPTTTWRCMSNSDSKESGGSENMDLPSSSTGNKQVTSESPYKVQEYFSYNDYSFYDLENEIDASGRRQTQPNPKVSYTHTNPWKKQDKNAA